MLIKVWFVNDFPVLYQLQRLLWWENNCVLRNGTTI